MFSKVLLIIIMIIVNIEELYNDYNKNMIGYILIPKYNYKMEIIKGINDASLSNDVIGSYSDLNNKNHIVLAGHNKENVFRIITKLKLNDIIIIDNTILETKYIVNKIEIVDKDSKLEITNNKLTLITCVNNSKDRLIINAIINHK